MSTTEEFVDDSARHLTKNPMDNRGNGPDPCDLRPEEWFCKECNCRITVSPDGSFEYGHHRSECSHSIYGDIDVATEGERCK